MEIITEKEDDMSERNRYDIDGDGVVTEREHKLALALQKANSQSRLANVAMIAFVVTMALLLTPIIPEARVESLAPLFDMYFFALASIVGTYMGVTAWMTRK